MRIAAALALVAALWSASAAAQQAPISEADRAAIRSIIEGQEEAFRRDDGATAFGYASPAIREMFGTPDVFMDMVRQGYPMVYRPRLFDFAEIVMDLWISGRESGAVEQSFEELARRLLDAKKQHVKVQELDEALFAHDFEV